MADTDSNQPSDSKQPTQPMTGNPARPPTGYETLRPDQGAAPFAETAPPGLKVPVDTPAGYAETINPGVPPPAATPPGYAATMAPTKPITDSPQPVPTPALGEGFVIANYKCTKMLGRGGFGKVYLGEAPGGVPV